jgi:hypothetical protein
LVYILEKFSDDLNKQEAIASVVKKNFKTNNFKRRQLFIYMSGEAMNRKELFERLFKADLLSMVSDPVSNVRLALAKVLRHHFISQINGNLNFEIIISIGAFVFDIDVNDAVRILKTDAKVYVRQLV